MKLKTLILLLFTVAFTTSLFAQTPGTTKPSTNARKTDRAAAFFHYMLAHMSLVRVVPIQHHRVEPLGADSPPSHIGGRRLHRPARIDDLFPAEGIGGLRSP